jgi:oligopeptide transport system ATP-binding protein
MGEQSGLLEVEDLNVEFHSPGGVVHAVSGVSFSLKQGEILGIVGESGSGKSVTAGAIMGLLPDTARVRGRVSFQGQDLLTMRKKEFNRIRGRDIAMIFQDPMTSLNPLYTVGNQMTETLTAHTELRGAAAKKRALELLELVSIPQPELRMDQYPHEFSGGMRQRIMIAMALACDPAVLIADEPTTALDVTIQAQILELMKNLKSKIASSIIMITHDFGIVADMCDRISVMYGSQIMETGPTDEVFYRTAHPYTASLLRCLPERAVMEKRKRLSPIKGSPVDLMMLPPGCAFASRCDDCMNLCIKRRPELSAVRGADREDHFSRCWITALSRVSETGSEP